MSAAVRTQAQNNQYNRLAPETQSRIDGAIAAFPAELQSMASAAALETFSANVEWSQYVIAKFNNVAQTPRLAATFEDLDETQMQSEICKMVKIYGLYEKVGLKDAEGLEEAVTKAQSEKGLGWQQLRNCLKIFYNHDKFKALNLDMDKLNLVRHLQPEVEAGGVGEKLKADLAALYNPTLFVMKELAMKQLMHKLTLTDNPLKDLTLQWLAYHSTKNKIDPNDLGALYQVADEVIQVLNIKPSTETISAAETGTTPAADAAAGQKRAASNNNATGQDAGA